MGEYTIGAVEIFNAVPAGTAMNLTSLDFPTGAEVSGDGAGELYSMQQSLTGFSPVANFTTKNIAALLGFIGLNGQCVGSGKAVTQVDLYERKLETCKDPLTATPHLRRRVTTGLLRLGSLSASRGQDATLSAVLDTFTDGTNAPVAVTDGVALPASIVSTRFTLGVCKIAGVQFTEIDSVELSFNVSITDKSPALGAIWPDSAGVLTVRPVLTLRGRDLSKVETAAIALGANAATHANTVIQLIQRENAASFYNFAGSSHITLTLDGMAVPSNLASSSAGSRSTNEVILAARDDGANAPVVITTGTTYTVSP